MMEREVARGTDACMRGLPPEVTAPARQRCCTHGLPTEVTAPAR